MITVRPVFAKIYELLLVMGRLIIFGPVISDSHLISECRRIADIQNTDGGSGLTPISEFTG